MEGKPSTLDIGRGGMRLYLSAAGYDLTHEASAETITLKIVDGSGAIVSDNISTTVKDKTATAHVASLPNLDTYKLLWSDGIVEYADLCERPYFTVGDFRSFNNGTKLSSSITDDAIQATRLQVEDTFDTAAGHAFSQRGNRETIVGDWRNVYSLEVAGATEIISCTLDGVDIQASIQDGMRIAFGRPIRPGSIILIHYLHGDIVPVGALLHNALVYANALVGAPAVNPRATGMQSEFGYAKFAVAGKDGATGIPEVDAFLSSDPSKGGHGIRRFVVA